MKETDSTSKTKHDFIHPRSLPKGMTRDSPDPPGLGRKKIPKGVGACPLLGLFGLSHGIFCSSPH